MNAISRTQKGKSTEVRPRIDEDRPIPPRYWWLKRLSSTGGLFVIALVCLRLWWGWEANRRLQAEIDSYVAAGQPVYADDFETELAAVPDDQNAALPLEKAVQALSFTIKDAETLDDVLYDPHRVVEEAEAVQEIIRINRAALELVREARSKSMVAWNWPVASTAFPGSLSAHRKLAKLQWLATVHAYHQGNHAEMLELIMDLLAHARSVSAHPNLICNLVGTALDWMVVRLIEYSGASMNLDRPAGQNDSTTARRARRAQIRQLIESLLCEEFARHSTAHAFYAERAWFLNLKNTMAALFGNRLPSWVSVVDEMGGPIFTLDTITGIRFHTLLAKAVGQASWSAASTVIIADSSPHSLLTLATQPFSLPWLPSLGVSADYFFRRLAMRRMGALALAIRLYEVDHGHRPEKLVQLVPAYLPAVPADPFATDAIEIRYQPDAEHAVLYSIGSDGKDDGGIGRQGRRKPDLLFYLDGDPTKRKGNGDHSSTEAGEDDENTENSQGEGE